MAVALSHAKSNAKNRGSLLLEAFIAIIIMGIAFMVILDVGSLSVKTVTTARNSQQANFLAKEEMEIARSYRDGTTWASNGLGTVNAGSNNPYYFTLNTGVTPNTWTLNSGSETTGIFTRKVVFDLVSRDTSTQNIESTYNVAHNDVNTRKVTVTITWPGKTLNLVTYLTNWK